MDSNPDPGSESPQATQPPQTDDAAEPAPSDAGDNPDADAAQEAPQSESDHQMPDASSLVAMAAMHIPTSDLVHVLVGVFDAHAWRSMGLVPDHSGEVRKDMAAAQTAIDCLAFMVGKIEASLEDAERRDVQRRLMDLRMNYVAKLREG